ncbi:Inner membrane protein yagU [Mannheimia haemolytica]|uniref:Inner membrane protein yagU n=1 Tax=Mannheimia haemolytica TaxID=75985 RepID=A0A378MW19_MANHA|nr:Inner membrane protein yagU [Mannheimia haemolytica]
MSIFQQTNPNRRRYGLAVFIGLLPVLFQHS